MQFRSGFLCRLIIFLFTPVLAWVGFAQTPSAARPAVPTPQITRPIDESNLVPLTGAVSSLVASSQDLGLAPDTLPMGRMILVLKMTSAQKTALDKLVNDQQNSKSPSYHQWLQPQQFGAQFGAASQDIAKITQWLENYGFAVEPTMAGRNLVIFSGTHAQVKTAFHTEIHSYKRNGQTYWANATDPQIPAAIAPVVSGFSSLNNFPRRALHTAPQVVRRGKSGWEPANPSGNNLTGASSNSLRPRAMFTTDNGGATQTLYLVGPSDLAKIYNIQPLWDAGIDGSGQTIAIVSDSDIDPADVDSFRSSFGLPAKKLNVLYYGPNPGKTGDEGEADLDVEWSGAVAKNATIDLVVAANTAASGGIDGAAAYIINNNLAPLLNVSYGACEEALGTSGNQYYSLIWEQAAAQGITVLAAAGDAGSAVCDDGYEYAQNGLSVSGLSSTPYNVSVGGTDFYPAYNNPSIYWSATNDPTTLQSALSYVPETPWNNTCASPDVFAQLKLNGITDATPEAVCNDVNEQEGLLDTIGGSGGASNCTTVDDTNSAAPCSGGYPKPAWQSGVTGIPSDGVRDLPDVSLMAGNGLWNSAYIYCQSDSAGEPCDVQNALEAAGGTSFASPIFAGMLALAQQKTGSPLGNANYVLYKMAAAQYADSSLAAACQSANVAAGNACVFYDVTSGSNTVPCLKGTADCTPSVATDRYGLLPGYDAAPGYDLATGLGTINTENLVNGWNSAASSFLATTTQIAASGSTTASYGTPINVQVTVAPVAPATGTPSGDVGVISNSTAPNSISIGEATLSGAQATLAALPLPVGTYQLFAHYAGDATFSPSQSPTGVTVTVTPGTTTAALTARESTIHAGQYVTLTLNLSGAANSIAPTGTITFTNTTNGAALGSRLLAQSASAIQNASVSLTISAAQLQSGANVIAASYSGDANYAATAAGTVSVGLGAQFTASVNPASLTVAANGTGSVTVTATPGSGSTLTASSLTFACPSNLPAGLACSFSAPAAGTGGIVTSTLTLQLASPLTVHDTQPLAKAQPRKTNWPGTAAGAAVGLACLLIIGLPRRRVFLALAIVLLSSLASLSGCGGSGNTTSTPTLIATTTSLSFSPSTPAFGNPVTLTAKVAPNSGTGTPTGSIAFTSGSTSLGTASLASGAASLTVNNLTAGSQSITAAYGGDATYAASTSSSTSVDIPYSTTLAITVADNAGDTSSANLVVNVQ